MSKSVRNMYLAAEKRGYSRKESIDRHLWRSIHEHENVHLELWPLTLALLTLVGLHKIHGRHAAGIAPAMRDLKYETGDWFFTHRDLGNGVSVVIYLDDTYTGGELVLDDLNQQIFIPRYWDGCFCFANVFTESDTMSCP
jgi:hypothetical protein